MIPLSEFKRLLHDPDMPDEKAIALRDAWYELAEIAVQAYLDDEADGLLEAEDFDEPMP